MRENFNRAIIIQRVEKGERNGAEEEKEEKSNES